MEGTTEATWSQEPDDKASLKHPFGTKKRGAFCCPGGPLFWGAKQGQTNRQTNGQRARVYEKNSQGVKSSSSSSLALVLDSSRAEACISG